MNQIRKTIGSFFSYILAILLALFLPFILIFVWVKSIFSDNVKDHVKVEVTKQVIVIVGIFAIYILIEKLSNKNFWEYALYLGIGILVILTLKQKFYDKK